MSNIDLSVIDWKPLGSKILAIIKKSIHEYWDLVGVPEFVEEIAYQLAKWKTLAATTTDPEKRMEYEGNIADLNAQMDIKIASALLDLDTAVRNILKKVLQTVAAFMLDIAAPMIFSAFGIESNKA